MELCSPLVENNINKGVLRENLAILHTLNIVHNDIKTENIMLSKYYRKVVFIDFGLANFIKEEIGFKTYTSFKGSINFCSD
jgi:serine/threonine protein kinase